MMEHDTTDGGPWPWANWEDDGTVDQRFRTDGPTGDSEAEGAKPDDARSTTFADGGNTSADCPECATATVSGQGLHWCTDCDWTGSR